MAFGQIKVGAPHVASDEFSPWAAPNFAARGMVALPGMLYHDIAVLRGRQLLVLTRKPKALQFFAAAWQNPSESAITLRFNHRLTTRAILDICNLSLGGRLVRHAITGSGNRHSGARLLTRELSGSCNLQLGDR
mmetsp:Transcript_97458/g.297824  ORF Transcript_97458/g.297824 Transcript_97458/m.297824 type:complete len:134 (-) Transcript_97458:1426-1827(-)